MDQCMSQCLIPMSAGCRSTWHGMRTTQTIVIYSSKGYYSPSHYKPVFFVVNRAFNFILGGGGGMLNGKKGTYLLSSLLGEGL